MDTLLQEAATSSPKMITAARDSMGSPPRRRPDLVHALKAIAGSNPCSQARASRVRPSLNDPFAQFSRSRAPRPPIGSPAGRAAPQTQDSPRITRDRGRVRKTPST